MNTYHQHTERISVGWLIRCATAFGRGGLCGLSPQGVVASKSRGIEKLERELRLVKRENELKHQAYAVAVSPKHRRRKRGDERSFGGSRAEGPQPTAARA